MKDLKLYHLVVLLNISYSSVDNVADQVSVSNPSTAELTLSGHLVDR